MGCCGSKHPHLDMYFAELAKIANDSTDAITKAMGDGNFDVILGMGDGMKKREEEMKVALKIHAENAFKHHDKAGNNILDQNESEVFFQDYVACYVKHFKRSGLGQAKKSGALAASLMGAVGGGAMKREIQKEMNDQLKQLTDQANQKMAAYEQSKATLNKAAFAMLDLNKDGCLQQEEVVNALTPQHPKNVEFHVALGLMTQFEAKMAGMLAAKNEGGEAGCATQ